MKSFTTPGTHPATATGAMAATSSPLATLAAINMLKSGGNAVDAAVTASAVLCITEPHMTGIGGDCFAIIGKPDGTLVGLNGSGRSAAAATPDWLAGEGFKMIDPHSPHSVTVPGAIDAWDTLLKAHGTISLADALQPAIELAEQGVATTARVAFDWPEYETLLASSPGGKMHYLKNGKAPAFGDPMAYPALAKTLRRIASHGRDDAYTGEIAADILSELKARGSLLTMDDFAATKADWVNPISTPFEGYDIHEIPPSGQGLTVLIALNILKRLDIKKVYPDSAHRHHFEIEAIKSAWILRNRHIADPAFAEIPIAELLSDKTADALADAISPRKAAPIGVQFPQSDTVYLSVVDKNRLAVSFINSIYWGFGSGIITEKTGITLQNRGAGFVTKRNHPNCIGPSKRPLHTIIPAMATKNGKIDMSFGVMGGDFQPMGHVNVVLNRYCYGMDPQESLDMARMAPDGAIIQAEESVPALLMRDLARRGHRWEVASEPLGGGQIITIDHNRGILIGGSDPRKDGCAMGIS